MKNKAIGVFDSGLGGLTAVRELNRVMPGENIIYFGDTGRVPYGTRSSETVIRYTKEDIEFLIRHDIKFVIAACGTASSVALPHLEDQFDIKIMGVLESACNAAVKTTKNGKIGVIGTSGTIKSGKYEEIIKGINKDLEVFSTPCPMFVPLVENGYAESEAARLIAKDYLTFLKKEKVDTLILGCTHYPLLKGVISDIMGEETVLLSPGELTAIDAKAYLMENGLLSERITGGRNEFYVSDSVENFAQLGSTFLGSDIGEEVKKTEAFTQ